MNDGVIPPLMRWLLEAEAGGVELLNKLPSEGRLTDINMTDEIQRESLVRLVDMTRDLMKKLANQGQPIFRSSIERLVSSPASETSNSEWLDGFAGGVPPDLFRAAYIEWFGNSKPDSISQDRTGFPARVRLSSQIRSEEEDLLRGSDYLLDNNAKENVLAPSGVTRMEIGTAKKSSTTFRDPKAWDQLNYGGWMIDRQRMAIVYVPRGHADEWLSRCIELEQVLQGTNSKSIAQQCRTCHSLAPAANLPLGTTWKTAFTQANEQLSQFRLIMSPSTANECWRSNRRAANLTQITKFDHTPHLSLPSINDCRSCHQLNDSSETRSEFAPMQRSQCVGCHQPNAAGESCTLCHNYHVGRKGWLGGRR